MPSRKSAAVSSSQWTESFGCGATDCARAKLEAANIANREIICRAQRVVELVRFVMFKSIFLVESSGATKSAFTAADRGGRGRPPHTSIRLSLFQVDFLQQVRTYGLADLGALFGKLLSWCLASQDFVANRFSLCGQAVHSSVILVFDGYANIPILRVVLGLFEEHFVVHDQTLLLLFVEERLAGLLQAGEIGIHLSGLDANQRCAPDGAFGVVFLGEQRRGEQQHENDEPIELLHSGLLRWVS